MATINLGNIKFNWQGAYNGATAYAVDDVVSYNGSSYICKLASTGNLPTNTTYFDQMSSAGTNGTNGTDVGTVITTQGDILYRDGSGLQRLGAGTSGQALITNGAGANPSWGDVSGGLIKATTFYDATRQGLPNSADTALISMTFNKQEDANTSKVIVIASIPGFGQNSNTAGWYFDCLTSGMTTHNTNDSFAFQGVNQGNANSAGEVDTVTINKTFEDTTNFGVGNHTFELGYRSRNGTANFPYVVINPNSSDDPRCHQKASSYQFLEVLR